MKIPADSRPSASTVAYITIFCFKDTTSEAVLFRVEIIVRWEMIEYT